MNLPGSLPPDVAMMGGGMHQPEMDRDTYGHDADDIMSMGENVTPMVSEEVMRLRMHLIALKKMAAMPNAAEAFEPEKLAGLGQTVCREFQLDDDSRSDWKKTAHRAMDMARQKRESKSDPWPNASNVKFPMLTTAALQFAARAYPAIVDGPRIVKCQVLGADPQGQKAASADRVSQHMSYQFLVEMDNWEADLDTALHQLPIVGCVFKKVYEDGESTAGCCSDMVSAFDFVVNQKTRSLESVPRATHIFTLYPHEIETRIRQGKFSEFEYANDGDDSNDEHGPHTFYEQYRYFDSDDDGMTEPWIVTVHEKTQRVVKMVVGFDPDEIKINEQKGKITHIPKKSYFVKIPFIPDPEGGFYDIGFGKLLEPLCDVIDTTINQMMDAGTLQNSGGGFIASGVDIGRGKSQLRMRPGEYRTVQTAAQDLRAGIYSMDHPGPSKTLFDLLSLMIDSGKDIAAIQDILVGDMPRNQTATATMAMIEQGLKVFTAIYKRIFRALRQEYGLVFAINKRSLNVPKYIALLDQPIEVSQHDYQGDMDVMPTADPASITDMQRMAKAQFVMEEAKNGNPCVNLFEATKRAFEAARVDDIEKILIRPGPKPQDALMEEEAKAKIDLAKAQTVKTVADAEVALAQVGIPIGMPVQVGQPLFGGGGMPMGQPMPMGPEGPGGPEGPMPPGPMGGPDGGPMPPDMIEQGGPPPMEGDPSQGGEIPPEVLMQIQAEMDGAGDGMPGDGLMPQ